MKMIVAYNHQPSNIFSSIILNLSHWFMILKYWKRLFQLDLTWKKRLYWLDLKLKYIFISICQIIIIDSKHQDLTLGKSLYIFHQSMKKKSGWFHMFIFYDSYFKFYSLNVLMFFIQQNIFILVLTYFSDGIFISTVYFFIFARISHYSWVHFWL